MKNVIKEGNLSQAKILRRLFALAWRYRAGCAKALLLQALILCVTLWGLALTGAGIDFIRKQLDASAKAPVWPLGLNPPPDWGFVQVLFAISAFILSMAVLKSLLSYSYSITMVKFLQRGLVVDIRSKVYDRLQEMSFRFFDSQSSGTLINRVTSDVQALRLFIDGVLIQCVIISVSLAVYMTYMVSINPKLTLACMATIPIICALSLGVSLFLRKAYRKGRELADAMILLLCERVQGIHVVKGFAREEEELKLLEEGNDKMRDQKLSMIKILTAFPPAVELCTQTGVAILLAYGGYLVVGNELALGTGLIVFLGLLQRFSGQVHAVTGIIDNVQQSITAAGRVFDLLETKAEIVSPPNPIKIGRMRGEVEFKNVFFTHGGESHALSDISFVAKTGQTVGVLGSTGSGKSTLLSLIPRFYDVSSGAVLLDGEDLRNYDLIDLRRQVGIVFQESFLFSNTIAANISFGKPDATMEQIVEAAKTACADEFIVKMSNGYSTVIGESGIDLSGGQRQRLALARAILSNPPILLLDDPMAALDSQTEKEILEGLEGAVKGRTTFLVSHRINVLKRTDFIIVLHDGRIAQTGTHAELMGQKGHYRRAARIQTEIVVGKVIA